MTTIILTREISRYFYLYNKKANSKVYDVVTSNGIVKAKSKDLKIGDIVIIVKGDRVPADMLTLYSDN